jgi:hypothetical protein
MAITAGTVWEMRTTGGPDHGGGFNPARDAVNGVDYSQQADPQLALTNCTQVGGSTTLTTATAGSFTAAMAGNICYISGEHFTTGWYEIVTFTDQYNVVLDRTATVALTDGHNGTCNVGGAVYIVNGTTMGAFLATFAAGNNLWIKAGTYTITTAAITAGTAGTGTATVVVEGYNATRGDHPTGTSRPLIDMGAYVLTLAIYWNVLYLQFAGTSDPVIIWSSNPYITALGCRFACTSTGASRRAFGQANFSQLIGCELTSIAGTAMQSRGATRMLGCWIHDSVTGILTITGAEDSLQIDGCLFEACSLGIYAFTPDLASVHGCSFVGCGTGIEFSGASIVNTFLNNIFAHCTKGINLSGGTNYKSNLLEYNNWYGNGTDVTNVTKGAHDTATNPTFQGIRSWTDFVVSAGSNVIVTSATGGLSTYFQAGDSIWFDAAADWTSGCYRIVTVDSANQLTLATSPAAVNKTGGIARTIRTAVGVSDCRPTAGEEVLDGYLGLSLGVG